MITRTYRDDTVKIADRVLCMCGKLVLRSLDRSARCEIVCFGALGWLVSINRFKWIGWLFVSFILSGNICKNPLCMLRPEIRVQYARWRFNLHNIHADICSLLSIESALYHPPFFNISPMHDRTPSAIIPHNCIQSRRNSRTTIYYYYESRARAFCLSSCLCRPNALMYAHRCRKWFTISFTQSHTSIYIYIWAQYKSTNPIMARARTTTIIYIQRQPGSLNLRNARIFE